MLITRHANHMSRQLLEGYYKLAVSCIFTA